MIRDKSAHNPKILITDQHAMSIRLIEGILRSAGYTNLSSTTESQEAVTLYNEFAPDVLVLDLHLFHVEAIIQHVVSRPREGAGVPMLLTAKTLPGCMPVSLSMGANDFVSKPFDPAEFALRIRNLLETRQ